MKSKNFNSDLWSNILQYELQKALKSERVTMKDLKETFNLNERQALIYHTILINKDNITGSINSDSQMKLLKKSYESEKKKNENLEAKLAALYEELEVALAIKVEPNFKPLGLTKIPIPKVSTTGIISSISDAHVEEMVRPESVHFLNEYNLDIARQRILSYFYQLSERGERQHFNEIVASHPVVKPQLLLGLGGDFITGWIHPEGVEVNALNPVEAIKFAQDCLISGIDLLVNENNYSSITIVCTPGNHARITEKKRYATGYKNSFEWLMFQAIKNHVERMYPQVTIHVAESEFTVVEFLGKNICFSHGDHFRYAGGIGGLLVPAIRWVHKMSQVFPKVDLFVIGHWHSYMALPDSKILINGSVIGYSAFAMGLAFKPEPPKMQLQIVDEEKGFTTNDPIFLN